MFWTCSKEMKTWRVQRRPYFKADLRQNHGKYEVNGPIQTSLLQVVRTQIYTHFWNLKQYWKVLAHFFLHLLITKHSWALQKAFMFNATKPLCLPSPPLKWDKMLFLHESFFACKSKAWAIAYISISFGNSNFENSTCHKSRLQLQ